MGHPWVKLLYDDNLLHGRNWPLAPLWVAVAPYLFFPHAVLSFA